MSTLRNKPEDYATTIALETYATEDEFKKALLCKKEFIVNLAYIVHDKDEGRDPHIHAVITLTESMQLKRICGWLKNCKDFKGSIANTFAEELLSAEAMVTYLTHDGQEGKHQYLDTEIKVLEGIQDARGHLKGKLDKARESKERKEARKAESEEDNVAFLDDLIARKPHREMARKYGRDYMKNYKQYRQFAWEVEIEEGTKTLDEYMQSSDCVIEEQIIARMSQERARGYESGAVMALDTLAQDLVQRIYRGESYYKDVLADVLKLQKEYIQ